MGRLYIKLEARIPTRETTDVRSKHIHAVAQQSCFLKPKTRKKGESNRDENRKTCTELWSATGNCGGKRVKGTDGIKRDVH